MRQLKTGIFVLAVLAGLGFFLFMRAENQAASSLTRPIQIFDATAILVGGWPDGKVVGDAELWAAFSEGTFFGAFASGGGASGYAEGYNSAPLAEIHALEHCRAFATIPNECSVIAWLVPNENAKDGFVTLTPKAASTYQDIQLEPKVRAIAIHGNGAIGSWIGGFTVGPTVEGALSECDYWVATNPPADYLTDNGCSIIEVTR